MMEKINGKGQTFSEFIEEYKSLGFSASAQTVDTMLFAISARPVVLLVQRNNFPDIYEWAFPGGFIDGNESAGQAAARELLEETGLSQVELHPFCTVSTPNRDPRGQFTSHCFLGVMDAPLRPCAGDDAADARWFYLDYAAKDDVYEIILKSGEITLNAVIRVQRGADGNFDLDKSEIISKEGIAFDHAKLILYALETL